MQEFLKTFLKKIWRKRKSLSGTCCWSFRTFFFGHCVVCSSPMYGFWLSSNCSCTIRYLDDVRSLNSSKFGDNVDCIYLIELEIKDSSNTDRSASYVTYIRDLHVVVDDKDRIRTYKRLKKKTLFKFSHCESFIYLELLRFRGTWGHPWFIMGDLYFSIFRFLCSVWSFIFVFFCFSF
jgi:hypothetical protein